MTTDSKSPSEPQARILGELASDIKPEVLAWLWPDYIPQGLLTLVAGDPGSGKSTVVADLVGRYTSGRPFPDGAASTSGNVVMFNAEDPKASVMLPRLILAGADRSRIRLVGATRPDADNPGVGCLISLPDDLEYLSERSREAKRGWPSSIL